MTYNPLDLSEIRNRVEKATAGPWHSCGEKCDCVFVMQDIGPICEVVKGKWGDDYVSIKLEGGSLDRRAVGYMDQITYGEVPLETFRANRNLIAKAPEDLKALLAECETLRETVSKMAKALNEMKGLANEWSDDGKDLNMKTIEYIAAKALSLPAVQALREKENI